MFILTFVFATHFKYFYSSPRLCLFKFLFLLRCRDLNLYRAFTAADVSDVYFSGLATLPVIAVPTTTPFETTPTPPVTTAPPVPTVPPGCSPMPPFIYSNDTSSADFGHQPNSYISYNISGHQTLLRNQCANQLFFFSLFSSTHVTIFFSLQSHIRYGDAALLNATINARIRYGNSSHVCDGCRQQLSIENCG